MVPNEVASSLGQTPDVTPTYDEAERKNRKTKIDQVQAVVRTPKYYSVLDNRKRELPPAKPLPNKKMIG